MTYKPRSLFRLIEEINNLSAATGAGVLEALRAVLKVIGTDRASARGRKKEEAAWQPWSGRP